MNQKSVRFRFVFPRFVSWRANWLMPTVSICHIDWYGHGFNPEKVRFRDESHQWGVEPGVWVNPEKLCSEMKGISAGLNWMRVPVQPRKVRFRDDSHQWGVEPRVWVQPRKVVLRDERYQWGVETRMWVPVQPRKVRFQFRIAEDAKRCLAVALDVFLRTHFHIVSLLAQHRGSQTPKRDDFLLAEQMSDEAAVQNSVEKADLESGTVRKRSRGPQTERVDWSFKSKGFEILRVQPVGDLYTGSKARPQGAKNSAGSFRTQWPIQFLCGSISKRFLSGSGPHGSRIPVRIDS